MVAILWPYMEKINRVIEILIWTSLKADLIGVFIQTHKNNKSQSSNL